MENRYEEGLKIFHEMMPEGAASGVDSSPKEHFGPELFRISMENVYGTLWSRPGLDRRSRSLVSLGILIALRASEELAFHFPMALRNGLTVEELEEVVYHSTSLAGYPAAGQALRVAERVLNKSTPPT